MKRIFLIGCLSVIMFSCTDKSSNSPNPPPPTVNTMGASISVNGSSYLGQSASGGNTSFASSNDASGNLIIDISGNFPMGVLHLKLVNINAPGTYTINNGGTQYILANFVTGSGPNDTYTVPPPPPMAGKLTVEQVDAFKIKGTFFMTCTGPGGSVQLTGGTFDGKY